MKPFKSTKPFGKWDSPISVDLLTGSAIAISNFQVHREDALYFLESRPFEGGRTVLMKVDDKGTITEVVSKTTNVRTKVHEYGGCGFKVDNSTPSKGLVYSEFKDSVLYYIRDLANPGKVEPITPPDTPLRFASYNFHPTAPLCVAVCEDHTEDSAANVKNYVVLINLQDRSMKIILEGADFYSDPTFSPDGEVLIWKEWNHPNMPWTSSDLLCANFDIDAASVHAQRVVAGCTLNDSSAVTQPRFAPDGALLFAWDITGYQQLYISRAPYSTTSRLTEPIKGDFAPCDWAFGNTTYSIAWQHREVFATYTGSAGETLLARISMEDGRLTVIEHRFLTIDAVQCNPVFPQMLYITGSVRNTKGLFAFNFETGAVNVLKSVLGNSGINSAYLSLAQPLEIPIASSGKTYGFFYPPTSPTHEEPAGSRPPLLMRVHGGPTSFAPPATSLEISYWTSRGYAFFNLNYGGSSGFGRDYMQSLNGKWGSLDVRDAIGAATWLAENAYCDRHKMAIDGGSAGGETVLNVLCHSDIFAAACSLYGISDMVSLASDTHKFESQYLFKLIGGTPEDEPQLYHDRSAMNFAKDIRTPVMIQQGTEDRVVPINQAKIMVDEIQQSGGVVEFLAFPGEGHGFRGQDAQKQSLEGETRFFEKYLRL